jgi:WD40 repeat protein
MGVVYRARHRDLQAFRAIKILPPHFATDENFVARFRREATIAAGLRHPNVVLIYDVGQQDDTHYIVMDLVEGRSLRDVIHADKPMPLDRAIRLLRPLADALDFAHQHGVIHRDVKPTNVIVGANDHVTLLDFGIARAIESAQQFTRDGLIVGTPEYMAPEVVTGGTPGASADLYALGVVAFEMLTGHVPFRGSNTTAVAFAHVNTPPPSPRADRADLPEPMERVLLRQLAKNPADRFPNARGFVDALERAPAQRPNDATRGLTEQMTVVAPAPETVVVSRPQPAPPTSRPVPPSSIPMTPPPPVSRPSDGPSRGKPWLVFLVAAVLLVALGGYGLLQLGGRRDEPTATATAPAQAAKPGAATSTPPVTAAAQVTAAPAVSPPVAAKPNGPAASPLDEARAALEARDFPKAIGLLTATKARDPNTPGVDDLLFQAQLGQGQAQLPRDPDASAAAFAEALKLRPNDPQAQEGQRQANVAGLRRTAEASVGRDDDTAIGALAQVLQLDPNDADAKGRLYGLLIGKADRLFDSDAGQSRELLQQATTLDPNRPEAKERLARFAIAPANAERVREIAKWGKGTVDHLAFSPDGKLLAVASSYGVYLYDAESKAPVRFMETGTLVSDAGFSPDGQEIAAAGGDGSIRIFKVADGAPVRTLDGHEGPVLSVTYSPDGQLLLSGGADKSTRLWKVADGSSVRTFGGFGDAVRSVAFSPDGGRIAAASTDKTAIVWGTADGARLATLQGHQDEVSAIAFTPDGQGLATASQDMTVRLWRAADGGLVRTLSGHTGWVLGVAFSPDGQSIVSAGADNTARIWRVADGAQLQTLQGHLGWVVTAAVAGTDQPIVATGSRDGTIRFWRLQDGAASGSIEGLSSLVRGVAVSPDGQLLAAGLENGTVQLLRTSDGTASRALTGHREPVYGVAVSAVGQTLATAADDKTR